MFQLRVELLSKQNNEESKEKLNTIRQIVDKLKNNDVMKDITLTIRGRVLFDDFSGSWGVHLISNNKTQKLKL